MKQDTVKFVTTLDLIKLNGVMVRCGAVGVLGCDESGMQLVSFRPCDIVGRTLPYCLAFFWDQFGSQLDKLRIETAL